MLYTDAITALRSGKIYVGYETLDNTKVINTKLNVMQCS